jgi:hypothetical protein
MWMTTIDNINNYIIIDLEHYARTRSDKKNGQPCSPIHRTAN